ncbi:hypothetical protein ACPCUV_34445 [Streptomyces platensis]|uniref:hypothetical protein n=1 Tax=Streptomyces platensis TaxID=58346 RepID=UPI003C2D3F49
MRRTGWVLVTGWLAVLFCAGAVQAAPAGPPAPGDPTQYAYLAAQLRTSPVYVSDQIPREVPRSTAPAFAREARRLGVPTYVMVLPQSSYGADAGGLLAGVHDRLGRRGLYVALSDSGLDAAQTYGVDLPGTADAVSESVYAMPYDATPREVFRHFVEVVTSGQAHQRAEEARAAHEDEDVDDGPGLHTDTTERENQSFVTGIAVLGIPLAVLLVTVHTLQWRRVRRAAAAGGGVRVPTARGGAQGGGKKAGVERKGGGGKKAGKAAGSARQRPGVGPGPFPRARLLPLMAGAAVLGGLIAFTASQVFDDTTSGDGSRPTAADMRARIDRVSAGLRRDPLYLDPESRSTLDGAERDRLRKRLRELDVPVLIAALPTPPDDESGGSTELLAKKVHDRLRRDALMVFADPATGGIELVNYSPRVDDSYLVDRPRDLTYTGPAEEQLGRHLDELLTYVGKAPRAKTGGSPYEPPPADDPVEEKALPGLFTGDFEPGLVIGMFAAGLVFGLVAAARALARRLVRRRRPTPTGAGGATTPAAPDRPSLVWLRRTARQDLDALTAALEAATAPPEKARRRAWECLDAAALLIDGDSDGRIDADAGPVGLACAVVLARAGRTALGEAAAAPQVCHRNPLHGAARRRATARPADGGPARSLPVCEACRVAPGPVLRLRSSGGGGRGGYVPYATLPGPLAALGDGVGIDQLTRDVREYFGVH